jgi:pyruvate kinase
MPALPVRADSDSHADSATRKRTREIAALCADLDSLHSDIQRVAAESSSFIDGVPANYRESARNLIHYLALRRHDLRALQPKLSALGLSSLGRSEARVLASVAAVRNALQALASYPGGQNSVDTESAVQHELLAAHTQALLGPAPANRRVRIMVTMPTEAAHDYTLVHELVRNGMNCMRINCAHDDADVWTKMIEHVRRASRALGRPCGVAMDLAGPKLRTGPLEAGRAVLKIRPERDNYGRVTAPARVWLAAPGGRGAPSPADATLPLPAGWLKRLLTGNTLKFTDARGAHRVLHVVQVDDDGVWTELHKTSYISTGTTMRRTGARGKAAAAVVGELVSNERPIVLHVGDTLLIGRSLKPGRPATHDGRGRVLTPAVIGCTLPEVFEDVRSGDTICFDDGKIAGVVENVEPERATVKIQRARACGEKLRSDKGMNLPDSVLRLSSLTAKDIETLEFVVQHADMVSLSFANSAADVELLQKHLKRLGGEKLGLILKIETRRGFENLPEMLFAALRSTRCGVMIARGDLAVECGFERLAEVQEEILWMCEAAHVPAIWATQVLESLAKEGFPSRAEITDAAMSERAECVMLNKGPHIQQAVGVLDDILQRMQTHLTKKRSMLRDLKVAERFLRQDAP